MHKAALDAHIHANGACHEDDAQKQGVASHGAHSFSIEGVGEGFGALQRWGLDAHTQGGA